MKAGKIIPLVQPLTKLGEWQNNERAFRRSVAGKKSFKAWLAASQWIRFLEDISKKKLTTKQKHDSQVVLTFEVVGEIFDAIKKRDAKYFRDFAHFLETEALPNSKARLWLAEKHFSAGANGAPRCYTHKQLLDDAQQNGLDLDERQLRRLMTESGFSFKNSRRK